MNELIVEILRGIYNTNGKETFRTTQLADQFGVIGKPHHAEFALLWLRHENREHPAGLPIPQGSDTKPLPRIEVRASSREGRATMTLTCVFEKDDNGFRHTVQFCHAGTPHELVPLVNGLQSEGALFEGWNR